jgi:hypothetical protein
LISSVNRNIKFICFINVETSNDDVPNRQEDFKEYYEGEGGLNFNEDYRRRLIESNFELMNGITIQVTTDAMKIPKNFLRLDNLQEIKLAVA